MRVSLFRCEEGTSTLTNIYHVTLEYMFAGEIMATS